MSLSANGNVLAVGAPLNDGVNGENSCGHVRIYQLNSGNWAQIGNDIDGEADYDESGFSVSLSSDGATVAIGAPSNSDGGEFSGHVRVYTYNAENWSQIGQDIDGEAAWDESGRSLSLSGDGEIIAVAAPSNSGNGDQSGQVRVYHIENGAWVQIGNEINGESSYDNCGISVYLSADGSVLAIGATQNNGSGGTGSNVGHVRVYHNSQGNWTQIGNDIDGEAPGDQSGWSLSLSDDGSTVAIGSPRNDGNGDNAGHVRVFQNTQGNWTQLGVDIDGEFSFDQSGRCVSLSADGSVVAIGAFLNDENGFDSGHVRVFDLSSVLTSDVYLESNLVIYPNPTRDFVTLNLKNGIQLIEANIFSSLGKFIRSEENSIFSLADLSSGTYYIEIITDKGTSANSIILE